MSTSDVLSTSIRTSLEKHAPFSEKALEDDIAMGEHPSSTPTEEPSISHDIEKAEAAIVTPGQNHIDLDYQPEYLHGWRLGLLFSVLAFCLFLSTLELTIVSTALVSISNDLHGFQESSWVVTAYLLTYAGFEIVIAKASDIFGRKTIMMFCILMFSAFSLACGLSQTLNELIVFRAFQGIGGGGLFTMVFVILIESVSPDKYTNLAAGISSVFVFSSLLGPIFGGIIVNSGAWRWVFLLNVPTGVVLAGLLVLAIPNNFPYHGKNAGKVYPPIRETISKIDVVGALTLLAASILLFSALEEGGTHSSWRSATVLCLLIIGVLFWIFFFAREKWQSMRPIGHESVLPWDIISDRFPTAVLLHGCFTGGSFLLVIINLPQKFQIVNEVSPFGAGYRLLALMLCSPLGSLASGIMVEKIKLSPFYPMILGSVLQTIGLALMTTLPTVQTSVPAAQYGYEVILGLGFGLSMSVILMTTPLVVKPKDSAVFMGAVGQFRQLGGLLALCIGTNILNSKVRTGLAALLSPEQVQALLTTTAAISTSVPEELQGQVRSIFASAYNDQMKAGAAFGAAAILVTLLFWEKNLKRMP
ncbi:hypothetical protein MMC25_000532 [Agyrium rufum]|nr:hypothetical protein [Agyrium rufum]